MRLNTLFIIAIASTLSLVACGPSGGDDGGDDSSVPDMAAAAPDMMPAAATGLGAPCTPDAANPQGQGTCGAGETCLNLTGGSGSWCSKTCTGATPQTAISECDPSLTAAKGLGYCYLSVDFDGAGGNPPVNYCGVICTDTTTTCSGAGATCDGTCPSPLACTAALQSGNPPMTVAMGCE